MGVGMKMTERLSQWGTVHYQSESIEPKSNQMFPLYTAENREQPMEVHFLQKRRVDTLYSSFKQIPYIRGTPSLKFSFASPDSTSETEIKTS